jgi:hypothetical protein
LEILDDATSEFAKSTECLTNPLVLIKSHFPNRAKLNLEYTEFQRAQFWSLQLQQGELKIYGLKVRYDQPSNNARLDRRKLDTYSLPIFSGKITYL